MPEALATSTAHTRSITNSWSASRISAGFLITTLFSILVPEEPDGMPGGLGQGTESLTGVLEATVRDPYRSGPQRQTDQRDHGVTGTTRRRQAPPPIFTSARRHRKEPQLLISECCVRREARLRVAGHPARSGT